MTKRSALLVACILAASGTGGCLVSPQQHRDLAEKLSKTEVQLLDCQQENERLKAAFDEKDRQIETLQNLGEKRMDALYRVERIDLGRYSGGVDLDEQPGDDGIRVYLQPIDQDGSIIKAAGSVKVTLFDLAAPESGNIVGEHVWTVDELAKQWAGGFISYQYSLDCTWSSSPPAHEDITVRVEFTDYLTGKTFTAQKLCTVKKAVTGNQ